MDDVTKQNTWPLKASVAALLPLVYFLSSGPVIAIANRYSRNEAVFKALRVVYCPVGWLVDNLGFNVEHLKYVLWWIDLFGSK